MAGSNDVHCMQGREDRQGIFHLSTLDLSAWQGQPAPERENQQRHPASESARLHWHTEPIKPDGRDQTGHKGTQVKSSA